MADVTDSIISVYKAEVQGYIQEIDKIVTKVRALAGVEKKQASDAEVNSRSLISSGQQRKKLLDDEIKNLKSLEQTSKKAFTVPELKDFNQRILESKNNIALLKGEAGAVGNVTGKLKNSFVGIGAGIAAAFSINALQNFSREAIQVSTQFQSIRNAINFTQGSAEKGAEAFEFVKNTSQELGLELLSTANSFKLFSLIFMIQK